MPAKTIGGFIVDSEGYNFGSALRDTGLPERIGKDSICVLRSDFNE